MLNQATKLYALGERKETDDIFKVLQPMKREYKHLLKQNILTIYRFLAGATLSFNGILLGHFTIIK